MGLVGSLPDLQKNAGAHGGVVEALRYNPEGREFDSRLCH